MKTMSPIKHVAAKVFKRAKEHKTYMDLLKDPREEELKLLLDLQSTKEYNPGPTTTKHYI